MLPTAHAPAMPEPEIDVIMASEMVAGRGQTLTMGQHHDTASRRHQLTLLFGKSISFQARCRYMSTHILLQEDDTYT